MAEDQFAVPGPALLYVSSPGQDGTQSVARVDLNAVETQRERALCRALLHHALALLDEAEDPVGLLALARATMTPVDGA
jgi:hypothetical protein